jgi:galactonate dehydratase
MYDHLGGGDSDAVYGSVIADDFADAAIKSVADGFTALKVLAVPIGGPLPSRYEIEKARSCFAAVRDAVGDDVDLMVDLHGRTSPAGALSYGRALSDLNPWFFEEPCQPEDVTALAEVSRALPFAVATGERLISRTEFRAVLDHRAAAVLQPDVCHVGGITEMVKIAALADTYQVPLAPHNPLGPVAAWANLHVDFAIPNLLIQEIMRSDVPWRDDVVPTPPTIVNGWVELPMAPGLGVEVDERVAAQYPYEPETQVRAILPDGSVGDW